MKTILTIEESNTLIEKGINNANIYYNGEIKRGYQFTLDDILEILPMEILRPDGLYMLNINSNGDGDWDCGYECWEYDVEKKKDYIDKYTECFIEEELIDSLYGLLIWCLDNNITPYKRYD